MKKHKDLEAQEEHKYIYSVVLKSNYTPYFPHIELLAPSLWQMPLSEHCFLLLDLIASL